MILTTRIFRQARRSFVLVLIDADGDDYTVRSPLSYPRTKYLSLTASDSTVSREVCQEG